MTSSSRLALRRNSLALSPAKENVFVHHLHNSELIAKMYFFKILPVGDFVLPTPAVGGDGESPRSPVGGGDDKDN